MIRFAFAAIFALCLGSAAQAAEYIDRYHVEIKILPNGNLEVQEDIRVWVEGNQIKRGIYRWFPLGNVESYQRKNPISSIAVTRDGSAESIGKIDRGADHYAVYFGDKDVFLAKNRFYDYSITYRVDKAILQFPSSDQLNWNVIPFNWGFPINNISASVTFPDTATYLGYELFSGAFGGKDNSLNVKLKANGNGVTLLAKNFQKENGVTLTLKLGPDFLTASNLYPVIDETYRENNTQLNFKIWTALFSAASLVFLIMTIFVWSRVGKASLVTPTVFPQFYAPQNISPVAARYILRQGNIDKTKLMTIALVSLASQGILKLHQNSIERISASSNTASEGEKLLLSTMGLNHKGDSFAIHKDDEVWAHKMRGYAGRLANYARLEFESAIARNRKAVFGLCSGLMALLIVLFWLAPRPVPLFEFDAKFLLFLPSLGCLLASLYIIFYQIKNYSTKGGEIVGSLNGLKMYIKAAEHQTLQDEPAPTAKQFSAIYPYAFAMELNTVWADKFSNELAGWTAVSNADAGWYYNHNPYGHSFEGHLASFGHTFAAAANYTSPSQSGGSFGGGGFGGGGGGGGGW